MLESIIDIVRRAGELVRSANDVTAATHEKNGPADLGTEYDLAVQRFLIGLNTAINPKFLFGH